MDDDIVSRLRSRASEMSLDGRGIWHGSAIAPLLFDAMHEIERLRKLVFTVTSGKPFSGNRQPYSPSYPPQMKA